MDLGCQVWKRVWKVIFLVWNRVKIWRSGRHTPIKNSQEYSPGYTYQRELKEDNGTATGLHNTRFMSQARQTRHFARNECVRLSWLLERLSCRPVCTMIRSLCGSCLMTGENSLENTFRPPLYFPPFPFPYQRLPRRIHDSGVSFQAWQFKFIPTFRHTRCRNQHYYLSNSHYSAILCLVWDLLHSHRTAKSKIFIVM